MALLGKAERMMNYIGVQTEEIQRSIAEIINVLQLFKVVVDLCFGVQLYPGYKYAIKEF